MTNKIAENQLPDKIYEIVNFSKLKMTAICGLIFCFTIINNISLSDRLKATIVNTLSANPKCTIGYKSLNYSALLLAIRLQSPIVPDTCFGRALQFDHINFAFRGPSIIPFGPKFKLSISSSFLEDFSIYAVPSFTSMAIKISDEDVKVGPLLNEFLGLEAFGNLNINFLLKQSYTSKNPNVINATIKGTNLKLAAQKIVTFDLPHITLGKGTAQVDMTKDGTLKISQIQIGDAKSSISFKLSGKVAMNWRRPMASTINIVGKINFSKEFLGQFSIINLYLNKLKKAPDGYIFNVIGSLASPRIQ